MRSLVILLLVLASCAQKPTKMFVEGPRPKSNMGSGVVPEIKADTIVIDARSAFDFSLSRIQGSIWLSSRDFFQKKPPFEGLLEKDLYFHARRLARMGIGLQSDVIVVGNSQIGQGEDGELAFVLRYLGLANVRFVSHTNYRKLQSNLDNTPPRSSVPTWKPQLQEKMLIDIAEIKSALKEKKDVVIIDVRTEKDYLSSKEIFDLGAMNIPWKQFILEDGLPNKELSARLQDLGITQEAQLILVAERGAEASLAQVVLTDLGYKQARVLAGGLQLLRSQIKY